MKRIKSNFRMEQLKVVIVGDAGVGKTSLLEQYVHRRFASNYKATIGADFYSKTISIATDDGELEQVTLQLWDTAGQERFQSLTTTFYRGADICLVVHDLNEDPLRTQNAIKRWKGELYKYAPSDAVVAIIGNKQDLMPFSKARFETDDIYFCCSAKTGGNQLDKIFEELARKALSKKSATRTEPPTRIKMATKLKPAQNRQNCSQC